jgi:hypothetical protein
MAKLVWRVKLITELEPGIVSETEVARIERDDLAFPETLGLTLEEGKQLTAATQAGDCPRPGLHDGRAVPMVRALQGETVEQGLLSRHVPLGVW